MIDYALVQVRRCAEKYEFDMDEAEVFLGLRPVSQKKVIGKGKIDVIKQELILFEKVKESKIKLKY